MSEFDYIELFAGIGGFRQALDRLGGSCVFASEIDKFAKQSYTELYGGEELNGDITKIKAEDIPDHDLIVAGIPCQAFSVAGKRKGFEDTRGTLFFDVARIASEKQPKVVWIENVKGLVGHDKGQTLDTIVHTLNDIGYHVDFEVLNSKYFGVPQNRERIFIVALRDDLAKFSPWMINGTGVVAKGKKRISGYESVKTFNFDWPEQTEVTTRLRDVLEQSVDEKYYLSEEKTAALVAELEAQKPSVTGEIKCFNPRDIETGNQTRMQDRVYDTDGNVVALTSFCDRLNVLDKPFMIGHIDIKGHDAVKRVYSADHVGPTLTTMGGGHREPKIAEPQVRSLGNTNPSGNGMNGNVYDIDAGLAPTLTTNKGEGPRVSQAPKYRIRKLTPLECWRLQGFPDEAHNAVKAAGVSDSQLYKQAGNAVTVNVIHAIGERLLTYLDGSDFHNSTEIEIPGQTTIFDFI